MNFSNIKIKNINKYAAYEQVEKELFEAQRNSLIEFLRNTSEPELDTELIEMAERAAFVFVDKFPEDIKFPPPPVAAGPTI